MSSPYYTRTFYSLAEACRIIEQHQLEEKNAYLECGIDDYGRFTLDLGLDEIVFYFHLRDEDFSDVDVWRQLAVSINNNTTILSLELINLYREEDYEPEVECFEAFFAEIKNNKSIDSICLDPINQIQMFDLSYFLENNARIKEVTLSSTSEVTPEQCNILSNALRTARFQRKLDLRHCRFGNNGSLEHIVSACEDVETLVVSCKDYFQFTAVAALLRNPTAVLKTMTIDGDHVDGLDQTLVSREIATSLVGNIKLKELSINLDVKGGNCFETLLCNSSSLDDIYDSNHTLENITQPNIGDESRSCLEGISMRVKECLELNKNSNKNQVIRHKIIQYYFIGSFDMAPFASMPLSVLSKIMGLGGEMKNMHSAIFELMRGIPDLCNVSPDFGCRDEKDT